MLNSVQDVCKTGGSVWLCGAHACRTCLNLRIDWLLKGQSFTGIGSCRSSCENNKILVAVNAESVGLLHSVYLYIDKQAAEMVVVVGGGS